MNLKKTLLLTQISIMTAIICLITLFIKIPLPYGYANISDASILLFASVAGYAVLPAAAIGTMLADIFSGYAIYAPFTFVIKLIVAYIGVLAFKQDKFLFRIGLFILAQCLMVLGYFITDTLLFGLSAGAVTVWGNCVQGLVCVIITSLLYRPVISYCKQFFKTKLN